MKWLVTGASGLIGWQLVKRLAENGERVTAWLRRPADLWPNLSVESVVVDLNNQEVVHTYLHATAPDNLVHLSAQSLPARSWLKPIETMHANLESTINLLESIKITSKKPRFLFAGTSAQYSSRYNSSQIDEDAPIEPSSPYAVSKIAAEHCVQLYARAFGLDTVCFRPFLWIGPRKMGDVAADIARRVVAIERGGTQEMHIGRTDVIRDFIDIQDGIDALLLLAEKGRSGEAYNICNGTGLSIGALIEAFRSQARIPFALKPDPNLIRPIDELVRVGDSTKMRALGWKPQVSIDSSIRNILDYWRTHLQ